MPTKFRDSLGNTLKMYFWKDGNDRFVDVSDLPKLNQEDISI